MSYQSLSFCCVLNFTVNISRHDRAKAVEILVKDLKVFASFNEELFKEITQLLTLENFRYVISLNFPIYFCCVMLLDLIFVV